MNKTQYIQYISKAIIPILLVIALFKPYFLGVFLLKSRYFIWIPILCMLSLYQIIKPYKQILKLNIYDILIIILSLFGVFTYLLLPTVTLYHTIIWYYTGYVVCYFFFKQYSNKQYPFSKVLKLTLLTLGVLALLNVLVAFAQYFNFVPSKNKYFKVNGFFYSPNQLGVFLALGIVSLLSFIKLQPLKTTIKTIILANCLLFFGVLIYIQSRGALLGLLIAGLFLYFNNLTLAYQKTNILVKVSVVLVILSSTAAISFKLYTQKPDSISGRYFVLKRSVEQIAKQPFGHGINSFAKEYNHAKAIYFNEERSWEETKIANFEYHAFNDFLEIAFEMGLHNLLLLLFFFIFLFKNKKQKTESTVATAIIILLAVYACTNVIINLPILILTGLFCTQIIIVQTEPKTIFKFDNTIGFKTFATFLLITPVFIIARRVYAENYLYKLKGAPLLAIDTTTIHKTLEHIDHNGKEHRFIYYTLKKNNLDKKQAIKHLDTAFVKSAMPRIGKPLAYEYLKTGNFKKAIEIFKYNKLVEPYRYEARMDLFYLYSRNNDIQKALKIAQEVKNLPIKIPSKKITQYKSKASKYLKQHSKTRIDNSLKGNLYRKTFTSKILSKKLLYDVYQPPLNIITEKTPVLYVNDGIPYLRAGQLAHKVDSLIHHNLIQPLTVVFIEPKDINVKQEKWKIREELYFCNDKYNTFLTKELIPYIEKRYTTSENNRGLVGLSFGGLSAAYTAIKYPSMFQNIILQSPAFYTRKKIYRLYAKAPKYNFNVYLNYGTGKDTEKQDIPFINILKKKGYNLHIKKVEGGDHNWKLWEPQLNDILIKYYPTKKAHP